MAITQERTRDDHNSVLLKHYIVYQCAADKQECPVLLLAYSANSTETDIRTYKHWLVSHHNTLYVTVLLTNPGEWDCPVFHAHTDFTQVTYIICATYGRGLMHTRLLHRLKLSRNLWNSPGFFHLDATANYGSRQQSDAVWGLYGLVWGIVVHNDTRASVIFRWWCIC
jgi:hypothetical protein